MKINVVKRTLSLNAKKLMLAGNPLLTTDATLTIQYGGFAQTNELRLSRTQAGAKEILRH